MYVIDEREKRVLRKSHDLKLTPPNTSFIIFKQVGIVTWNTCKDLF